MCAAVEVAAERVAVKAENRCVHEAPVLYVGTDSSGEYAVPVWKESVVVPVR